MGKMISFVGRHVNSLLNFTCAIAWLLGAIEKLKDGRYIFGIVLLAFYFVSMVMAKRDWDNEKQRGW